MATVDQTLQALNALYNASDHGTKKQADDWLIQFRQTPAAWQVCDTLLSRSDLPVQIRFFAAQTMRTKVQFDFYELPTDSYDSLRSSLLNHISNFTSAEFQPIHTQLAIAIADLAIQMDEAWPNPAQLLFERFGQSPDSYATLLELLQMLREEAENYKLMTDSIKRTRCRERLQQTLPQVCSFLLNLACPTVHAQKRVMECFLSWIKYSQLQPGDMAQNPLLPECFKGIIEGGELAEIGTDIIVEILRMCSEDIRAFQPIIQVILSHLPQLQSKLESFFSQGVDQAVENHQDSILHICRVYVDVGECLIPLVIMDQIWNQEVNLILRVLLRCTDLPNQEISSITFDFWTKLAQEACKQPETDAKIDQFFGIYKELLLISIRRSVVSAREDPFAMDDEASWYRGRLLGIVEDCLYILTPNSALDHVLTSLQEGQSQGVPVQEAHFFVLAKVGSKAEVRAESVLWQLIQSLPPLINEKADETTGEGIILQFTKKTAIELLGHLSKWIKTRPEFLRSALEMISTLLLQQAPTAGTPEAMERIKQVQCSACVAFKDICTYGKSQLHDLVPQLTHLYVKTMHIPIRNHLFIVEGISTVVSHLRQEDAFRSGLEQLVMPLVNGIQSERENALVLSEILDRLTTIIRQLQVQDGTSKAAILGTLISNGFWPVARQCIEWHPLDSKVVEKSCRLLKHSMRCVPDMFKPLVPAVASTLVTAFKSQQHSSYLYSSEILANTYAKDREMHPVLAELFNQLGTHALQVLMERRDRLNDMCELVEDFYGMFERYLRYAPTIVLEAPTLQPTLQLLLDVILVQQKDAIEAVFAFMEASLNCIAESVKPSLGDGRASHGQRLRPHVLQMAPNLVLRTFQVVAQVPPRFVTELLPTLVECIRGAFPQEFPGWLETGMQQIPPSAASRAEQIRIGQLLLTGDENTIYDAMADLCYRCEQVVLRSRGGSDRR
mmetsp:Transcript_74396/g.162718  ORF Transcript_74396/g.162718 Transcript_74396/m.162718 type:complete len:954 (+) Transcript_74396:85-2946(+)